MSSIKYSPSNRNLNSILNYIKRCGFKLLIKNLFFWLFNSFIFVLEIILGNKKSYGKIIMKRGSFQELSKLDFKVKAVVSLSAIEHCDKEQITLCLDEMFGKISKGPLLITTSVHELEKDKYETYFDSWTFRTIRL